ncbi:MAG: hypothetical protein Q4C25_03450, partial [Bacillota bacterium]|nr:hypothetical protein [Bacillota bacterium]
QSPYPQMEMCGLEFCGNASRAFALYRSQLHTPPLASITVKVSGCDHPLDAKIDADTGQVDMQMPVPGSFREFSAKELGLNTGGILVNIDGISHLILKDVAPMADTFQRLKDLIYEEYLPDLPAFGVMFCDTANDLMTPVVYVKDVDSTYFEGSCASGTVAASFAIAKDLEDGVHSFTFQQPEGTLASDVTVKDGAVESVSLKGIVTLSEVITVALP